MTERTTNIVRGIGGVLLVFTFLGVVYAGILYLTGSAGWRAPLLFMGCGWVIYGAWYLVVRWRGIHQST